MRAALVEVDSCASGELTKAQLAEVMQLARVPLTLHETISIHRQLAKSPGCSEITVAALLLALDI